MSTSIFEILKEKVLLTDAISRYLEDDLKPVGTATYTTEEDVCPFCGHRECFRIKSDEEVPEDGFFNCFSCGVGGDLVNFVGLHFKEEPVDAARRIAKDFKIDLPRDYSPVQEIMNVAANYYKTNLQSNRTTLSALNNMTPMQFQMEVRKHDPEVLQHLQIGFSDGGLVSFLDSLGFEEDQIEASGLKGKKGGDYLPYNCFIYPHFVKGRVSHFTFKDPNKTREYQLPNKFRLNDVQFYNQDSIQGCDKVIIVEGENDLISVLEGGWNYGVIASIGQISNAQIKWVTENLAGKHVFTIFDPDAAGDKYRSRFVSIASHFESLTQIRLPEEAEDIDAYLKSGGVLADAFENHVVEAPLLARNESGESVEVDPNQDIPVIERNGAYYKLKYDREHNLSLDKITDFILELRNVYILKDQRLREIVAIREDGKRSQPILISSQDKVSTRNFKPFIANAIDGSFSGGDLDLIYIWKLVYAKGNEREVHLPTTVGHVPDHGGWLFRNCFISHAGAVVGPDDDGIMWYAGPKSGLKPWSIQGGLDQRALREVPALMAHFSPEDRSDMTRDFLNYLAQNLGDMGMALCMVAWSMACAYSDLIFDKFGLFPFLFFYGRHGRGKTNIIRWLLDLYGMRDLGYCTLPQLKSGVGVARKAAYYASLPMAIDEIRADKTAVEFYGTFRSWYNRTSRPMGAKDEGAVRVQEVRSTFIFGGQDTFTDTALRSRCVNLNIPVKGRDLVDSYRWMEANRRGFSAIGYNWILESSNVDQNVLIEGIQTMHKRFLDYNMEARAAEVWGIVGFFAEILALKYTEGFDIEDYVVHMSLKESEEAVNDDIILQFFNIFEGLMVGERPIITGDHVKCEEGKLYIWFAESFRLVNRNRGGVEETFSKGAVLSAIREEPYFLGESREPIGIDGVRRRAIVLDIEKAPDVIRSIGESISLV